MADSKAENKPVSIHIMGNEYHVSSPENEIGKLEDAARALDKRMREIKEGGRILGLEKVAVMAALNLSYELMHGESSSAEETAQIDQRLLKLTEKVDSALAANAQSELI
jgi:cell division protein ZapA